MLRIALLALLVSTSAFALDPTPISFRIAAPSVTAAPGETVTVVVEAVIPPKWHSYTGKTYVKRGPFPTTFSIESPLAQAGKAAVLVFIEEDVGFGFLVQTVSGKVAFYVPVTVDRFAPEGTSEVTMTVHSALCDDTDCRPADDPVRFTLTVVGKPSDSGLMSYFLMAIGAGLLALLTPCVFPMIPITVSFFIKRQHKPRIEAIADAILFSSGIVLSYTAVGFFFSVMFSAASINELVSSPAFNLGFGALVVFFALNLFGTFELAMPSGIVNRLSRFSGSKGEGILSLLAMGLLFALTSFTCTGPFVGQTLVSASQGQWLWPLVGMLGFSIAFSAPFFLLALFPSALKMLPKAGGWLNSVKVVMGFVELAASLKFLSAAAMAWGWGFLSRDVFLCSWIGLALACFLYLLGCYKFKNDTQSRLGWVRVLVAACVLGGAIWLGTGLSGRDMGPAEAYLPPGAAEGLSWSSDLDAGMAEARRTGAPVILEFSGYTCSNCLLMERRVLPEAVQLLQRFVRVRLYTDGQQSAAEAKRSAAARRMQQDRFKTVALPLYVILSPEGREVARFQGMTYDAAEFAAFLSKGLAP